MGAHFSKRAGDSGAAAAAAAAATGAGGGMEYSSELSSYEAACRVDPELRSFDAALHRRTSEAITALASGVEVRALSLGSLREVTGCLLDMNQEVVRVILDCKEDIWRSPDLFALVEDYFDCSLRTLDFCSALEHSLHRARDSHLLVHVALQRFAQEHHQNPDADADADADADPEAGRSRYAGTLEELRRFTAAGDPFTEEFFAAFHSVYVQQLSMLDRLQQHKRRLNKRIRTIRTWRRVSSIIFAATFAAVLICSVVAAAIAAPPVAAALAAAAAIPVGSMGRWIDSLFKNYQDLLRGQKDVLRSMQVGTYIAIKDLDSIRVLVARVEVQITSLLGSAEFALRDEEAVRLGIEEIQRKMDEFMQSIEDLGEQADRCSREIRKARTVVLQRIIRHPNRISGD
ncbi:UPF0496 protein 1-like [Ananas comosus]|uniref:UPF0496 protein 1-like n=1 Tax=Ananas comosus TaxID=4615 RepID=A0A6P5G892_ANACO|nr:UPF0496 protein 1-like [Ananas comosus]